MAYSKQILNETTPDPLHWNNARDVLVNGKHADKDKEVYVGENEMGVGFLANLKDIHGKLAIILTPVRRDIQKGEIVSVLPHTNLRKLRWV